VLKTTAEVLKGKYLLEDKDKKVHDVDKEWADAENDVWLPADRTEKIDDPAMKVLVGIFKLAYQDGKGSQHLVSLLIPNDCIEGMRILTNTEVRRNAGVSASNTQVFASTQNSSDHVDRLLQNQMSFLVVSLLIY